MVNKRLISYNQHLIGRQLPQRGLAPSFVQIFAHALLDVVSALETRWECVMFTAAPNCAGEEVSQRNVVTFAIALSAGLSLPLASFAEGLNLTGSKRNRASILKSQMDLLDGRLAKQYEGSTRLRPDALLAKATDGVLPVFRGSYRGEYLEVARAAARAHSVPEDLFLRLVQRESGWNPAAVSHKGATGLAQLMPGTADLLGVNINDPHENLKGGARYLRMMYEKFGSWRLALAAYNAGPGAVEQHGGIPPFPETENYVRAIMG